MKCSNFWHTNCSKLSIPTFLSDSHRSSYLQQATRAKKPTNSKTTQLLLGSRHVHRSGCGGVSDYAAFLERLLLSVGGSFVFLRSGAALALHRFVCKAFVVCFRAPRPNSRQTEAQGFSQGFFPINNCKQNGWFWGDAHSRSFATGHRRFAQSDAPFEAILLYWALRKVYTCLSCGARRTKQR